MNQPRQDQIDDIDVFAELSSDHASRDHLAHVAGDNQLTYNDRQPIGAEVPTIDDEITMTEVEIRERLIEWLVGFLPGGPRADQASLLPQGNTSTLHGGVGDATP
ncbi:MAG: hypothetical protein ACLQVF_24760 [Isosphaeraceae bacterium]